MTMVDQKIKDAYAVLKIYELYHDNIPSAGIETIREALLYAEREITVLRLDLDNVENFKMWEQNERS